jgi:N-acetylmuramoyl-L-alanine amidase
MDNQINRVKVDQQASSLIYTIDFSLPVKFSDRRNDQKQLVIHFENTILSTTVKLPGNDQLIRAESLKRSAKIASASEFTFATGTLPIYETAILDETNQFIISFKKSSLKGIRGKKIILDPGHGSFEDGYYDCGAIGPTGCLESYTNLQVVLKLKALLEKEGATVLLTREQEQNKETLSLDDRVEYANKSGADLYISIHQNASLSTEAKGCEVFYYNDNSLKAGDMLLGSLSGNTGLVARGNKKRSLAVTKEITTMPSLLIECAFLSNPEEEKMLQSDTFIGLIAEGISIGVKKFFESL